MRLSLSLFALNALLTSRSFVAAAPTPALDRRGGDENCPYPKGASSVAVGGSVKKTINIKYLGSGYTGCAYLVADPWPLAGGKTTQVVAKTPRVDRGKLLPYDEIGALHAINELYAEGNDDKGRQWAIIQYHPGTTVMQTAKWKAMFPQNYNTGGSFDDCQTFLRNLYKLVAEKQKYYAKTYGWESHDINWRNFLLDDQLSSVNIIDWGQAEMVDPKTADTVYDFFMDQLEKESMLPVRDTVQRMGKVQGICQSDLRDKGTRFRNPLRLPDSA